MEGVRLRVQDLDMERRQIVVRDGKGGKDRVTMLPEKLVEPMRLHLESVQRLHEKDLREGYAEVYLPDALARKYLGAGREWGWQWVFPSERLLKGAEDSSSASGLEGLARARARTPTVVTTNIRMPGMNGIEFLASSSSAAISSTASPAAPSVWTKASAWRPAIRKVCSASFNTSCAAPSARPA
jgi:CheY-like chemotaxis protein